MQIQKKTKACNFLLFILILFVGGGGPSLLFAQETALSAKDLEIAVWTWKDYNLPDLELKLARALQDNSGSAFHHYLYSYLLIRKFIVNPAQMSELKSAEAMAEQCLDLNPNLDFGYFIKAQIQDLIGKTDLAKQTLAEGEKHGLTQSWRLSFAKARIENQNNTEFAAASAPYLAALEKPEAIPDIILPFIIGLAKTHFDEPKDIMTALSSIGKYAQHPMILASKALLFTELKEYKKAYDIYSKLAEERSEPEYALNQSILRYKYLNEPLAAIKTLKNLSADLPEYLQSNRFYHLAVAYQYANQPKASETALCEALKNTKDRRGLIQVFSEQMIEMKKQKQLRLSLQAINEKYPGIPDLYAMIGDLLNDSESSPTQALPYYNNAITLEPDNSGFYIGHGLSLYKMKKYREALTSFDKAAELSPDDPTPVYNQACMLSLLGDFDQALKYLEKVLHMEPSYVEKIESDPDFLNLKSDNKFQKLISSNKASSSPQDLGH